LEKSSSISPNPLESLNLRLKIPAAMPALPMLVEGKLLFELKFESLGLHQGGVSLCKPLAWNRIDLRTFFAVSRLGHICWANLTQRTHKY
jgi:hypothetical protein